MASQITAQSLPQFTEDPGEQAVPQLHFTPARATLASWLPAFSTGFSLAALTLLPTGECRREKKELGSPGPAPENSPPPPTHCNPVAGLQCSRRNSISGLASRQHNLSPGSPPINGTQIGRHCEQIAEIKEEVVSGVSWGHSSARAVHYLLQGCYAQPT